MQPLNPSALGPVLALVVTASILDLRSRRIPNWLVLPFLVLGIASSAITRGWAGVALSMLGALVAVGVLGAFCYLGGMGFGDLKLCAAIGAWVGPSQLFIALVITGMAGGIMALGWAVAGGFLKQALRGTAGLVFGDRKGMSLSDPNTRKMPYAPAIAVGTILSFLSKHV
jgi:prepilin peptidase CpaA